MIRKLNIEANKYYYCSVCGKEIDRNYRLVLFQWGLHKYGFGTVDHYDLCDDHYKKFKEWTKNKKEGRRK